MHLYSIPHWFFLYHIIFNIACGLIAALVSRYAFKVYKISDERQPKQFGVAFVFIALASILLSVLDFFLLIGAREGMPSEGAEGHLTLLSHIGAHTYIALFLIGLVILFWMTLNVERIQARIFLIILVIIPSLMMMDNPLGYFHLIKLLFFTYIFLHYLGSYMTKPHYASLLVVVAFGILVCASVYHLFAVSETGEGLFNVFPFEGTSSFVIGDILKISGFALLFANLIRVVKHEPKKRAPRNHL